VPRGGKRAGAGAKPLPPGEKAVPVRITLSPATMKRLIAEASKIGKSKSMLVEAALKAHLP
jgi:hypothetical protein